MEVKPIYCAYSTVNETGTPGVLIGYSFCSNIAAKLAEGKGWFGGNGVVLEKSCLNNDGRIYILESDQPVMPELVFGRELD